MLLFVCNEAVESKLVKLENTHAVMLPPTVSVIWIDIARHKDCVPNCCEVFEFMGESNRESPNTMHLCKRLFDQERVSKRKRKTERWRERERERESSNYMCGWERERCCERYWPLDVVSLISSFFSERASREGPKMRRISFSILIGLLVISMTSSVSLTSPQSVEKLRKFCVTL